MGLGFAVLASQSVAGSVNTAQEVYALYSREPRAVSKVLVFPHLTWLKAPEPSGFMVHGIGGFRSGLKNTCSFRLSGLLFRCIMLRLKESGLGGL